VLFYCTFFLVFVRRVHYLFYSILCFLKNFSITFWMFSRVILHNEIGVKIQWKSAVNIFKVTYFENSFAETINTFNMRLSQSSSETILSYEVLEFTVLHGLKKHLSILQLDHVFFILIGQLSSDFNKRTPLFRISKHWRWQIHAFVLWSISIHGSIVAASDYLSHINWFGWK